MSDGTAGRCCRALRDAGVILFPGSLGVGGGREWAVIAIAQPRLGGKRWHGSQLSSLLPVERSSR